MMIESSFSGTDGKSIIHCYRMEMQGTPYAARQVALRLYEDMRHEVLTGKGQAAVYGDIRDFIRDVIRTDGSSWE